MSEHRWFLPEPLDVFGLLRAQLAVTVEGMDALSAWAGGHPDAAKALREAEARGDSSKRELLTALRSALVVPLEPEDVFDLAQGIDWILTYARDLVSEADALACRPDPTMAQMAVVLVESLHQIDAALGELGSDGERATAAADTAVNTVRRLDETYYRAMADLLEEPVERERIARRELYRRWARIGETVVRVAERVAYSVIKET